MSGSRRSSTSPRSARDIPRTRTHFFLYFFILTGLHLFHVLIGIVVLVLLLTQAGHVELGTTKMALVEGGACFWHLVDLLWIVLFPLLYLVS
ncbi:cytochrome c oxidase subunit III family protein [Mycobacterium xenopi 4042]|uniref:Probable cytochrome c oxidase subunit 3 n=1 Tax=Mycobacterium xenopi 4042 TaxID=1299334 RepID=X8AHT9_MYCXE|nr:cytochrome c oxidase subunit III family protein [Mycobacterium xenopi 4042]